MSQGNVNLTLGLNTSPATQALQQYYSKLNQGGKQAASSQKPVATALEKTVAAAKKLGFEYDKASKSFKNAKGVAKDINEIEQEIKQLNAALGQTQQAAQSALGGISQGFQQVLQGIPQGIGLAIGQQLIAPLTNFGSVLSNASKQAVGTFVDLDRSLRQTASISGATEAEFASLQAAVINLAKDTKFTTGELAEASTALARAGFAASEVEQALPGIAQGAAAAGSGMQEMADVVIAALGGFQKSTEETAEVVDILTAAANNSNTTVTELGEGLKYVGPIANSLGMSFEDVAAAAGLLANAGIKASTMGTALRSGLTRLAGAANGSNSEFAKLSRGTGRMATVLQKLGVDIKDTNGDLKSMPELLKTLKGGFDGLSTTEKSLAAKILFGDEAGSAWISLLNQNISEIERFAAITNNASGTAAETAEKNLSGIAGSLTFLSSAFDAASAKVGEFLSAILKPLVDGATLLLNAFNALPGPIQNVVVGFGALAVAIGLATAAYVAFMAVKGLDMFSNLATAVTTAGAQFVALAAIIKTKVITAYGGATAAVAAFNAMLMKTSVSGAISALFGKIVTGAKAAGAALKGMSVKQLFGNIASGATTAGASVGKFIAAAAPLAAVAAAIGAVALAWNTYSTVLSGVNKVQEETKGIMEGLKDELNEIGISTEGANAGWERSVERVGRLQATIDILREGLGWTTAETAQLNQTTVALGERYGEVLTNVDALIASFKEETDALKGLTKGTAEYDAAVAKLREKQEAIEKAIGKSIQKLNAQREAIMDGRVSLEELSAEEQNQIQMLDRLIKGFGLSKEMLDIYAGGAKDAAGASAELTKSLSDLKKEADQELKQAKTIFQNEMKAMEQAFRNLKAELQKGISAEVDAIKADIQSIKDAGAAFAANKDAEIRAIREVAESNKRASDDAIRSVRAVGEERVKSAEAGLEELRKNTDAQIEGLERQRSKTAQMYDAKIDSATRAHSRVMSQLDEELRAIDRQKAAVSERYDTALAGLRELTPAEQQLRNLEIARLQDQARMGGEEGLRARAALERMQREEQAKAVEAQKQAELKALEEERAKIEEQKRKEQEAHEEKMKKIKEEAAEADKKATEEIAMVKKQSAEKEEEMEKEIAAIKEETAEKVKQIQDNQRRREREAADEIRRIEDEKRKRKEQDAAAIKRLEGELQQTQEDGVAKLEAAETQYQNKRNQMLIDYRKAIGESHNDIISTGNAAWTTYANNAIRQIERVAAANRQAAATAANSENNDRWSGGPVSAGQTYTVNELGQEAFLSASGKLSMINAPAFGSWKAPSKGTVINAAQTEKLGLPAALDAASAPISVDPAGDKPTAGTSGGETRNLLRAIARATGGDNITNNVTIQAANTTQAASDVMVDLTKIKRRRIR